MTVRISTLDNGLRVVTDTMPHVETVTVGVWTDVGSNHESEPQNGLSHMLEHMAFKGTDRRNARDIAEEIENVGGYLNAYTSREQTTYYARLLKEDLGLGVDVLSDILQFSTFDPKELERERGVIIQEIGQANDTPDDIVFDMMQEAAYPDQPAGRPILGTIDRVRNFSRDDLASYMSHHYKADEMVVVAAGNVDHNRLLDLAGEKFTAIDRTRPGKKDEVIYKGGARLEDKDLEQVNLIFGFDGVSFDDPDYYTAQVMSMVLGGGMSSRLFQEVRENRGLVYSIYCFMQSYMDGGTFAIHAGTGPDQVAELIPVVAEEMHKLSQDVSAEEVNRARNQMKAGMMMAYENTTNRMEQLGRQMMIHGRHIPREEIIDKLDQVDSFAISRYMDRLLSDSRLSLGAIGPLRGLEDYDKVADRF
ncbi:M16 family metallopeptidase [Emcibacter nanhaiensis]|uniref:Insulinase family protein n=1 Tax=Emcibacter nanhaiensis TaxID=1505037 RepID=A0A501PBC4_9PROT|nr:pitrilysin family protein [Emcibacter nanhaiensis]TPD57663.1 insulinase family protein [Emcibacter nanhaiensis]